jgi:hypothetical protein
MESIGWIIEFTRGPSGTVIGMVVDKELMAIASQKQNASH